MSVTRISDKLTEQEMKNVIPYHPHLFWVTDLKTTVQRKQKFV